MTKTVYGYSLEDRIRIVNEAFQPGVSVGRTCLKYGLKNAVIYRWREHAVSIGRYSGRAVYTEQCVMPHKVDKRTTGVFSRLLELCVEYEATRLKLESLEKEIRSEVA